MDKYIIEGQLINPDDGGIISTSTDTIDGLSYELFQKFFGKKIRITVELIDE